MASFCALPALAQVALPQPATASELTQQPPCRIDHIEIRGLQWTQRSVVVRELPFQENESIELPQWQLGIARLWNIGLFSRIDARIEQKDLKNTAIFQLEERWTLNPLFSFASGGRAAWLRLGASEANLLGRYVEVSGLYERFQTYNGGMLWIRDPRLFNKRIDLWLGMDYLVRPRPGYADRKLRGFANLSTLLDGDRLRLGISLVVARNFLLSPEEGRPDIAPPTTHAADEISVRLGRVDTERIRQTGSSVELRALQGVTDHAATPVYGQLWFEALVFHTLGTRWNFALRIDAGAQTPLPKFLNFYLGGLGEIRGFLDNSLRADRFALVNAEARFTAYDSMWLAVVPTAFVDGAIGHDLDLDAARLLLSSGLGVRFLVPRFVKTGLRFDAAVPLTQRTCSGICPQLSIGVFQFF